MDEAGTSAGAAGIKQSAFEADIQLVKGFRAKIINEAEAKNFVSLPSGCKFYILFVYQIK